MRPAGDQRQMKLPVSVKGIVAVGGRFLLLRNERDEWELPGGRLEPGETPAACCAREILEETALQVIVTALVDAWIYRPAVDRSVLILAYGCDLVGPDAVSISAEHAEARLFGFDELPREATPAGLHRFDRQVARAPRRLGLTLRRCKNGHGPCRRVRRAARGSAMVADPG